MVEQLKFNPMFQPAMRQVFGRTLICRDIDRASHFAKNSNHDCVTLDGKRIPLWVPPSLLCVCVCV